MKLSLIFLVFFSFNSGDQYYRFDSKRLETRDGYPQQTNKGFMRCDTTTSSNLNEDNNMIFLRSTSSSSFSIYPSKELITFSFIICLASFIIAGQMMFWLSYKIELRSFSEYLSLYYCNLDKREFIYFMGQKQRVKLNFVTHNHFHKFFSEKENPNSSSSSYQN